MARIQLVIFDFDGTLVDTAPDIVTATNLFLTGRDQPPLPESRIRDEIGLGLKNLLFDVFDPAQMTDEDRQEIYDEFTIIYEQNFLKSPRIFEGALDFLHAWDGRFAIVSNKRERFIRPLLKHLGLDVLDWSSIIGGDTFEVMKPHPKPFLEAMAEAGVTPEETVVVGDGQPDVDGAVAVGSRMVAVDFGYVPSDDLIARGAWARIAHYRELLPLIRELT